MTDQLITLTFTTADGHAPEPGLGGAAYTVVVNGTHAGEVRSAWDRTNGLHWTAAHRGALLLDGSSGRRKTFESRRRAAEAVARLELGR